MNKYVNVSSWHDARSETFLLWFLPSSPANIIGIKNRQNQTRTRTLGESRELGLGIQVN